MRGLRQLRTAESRSGMGTPAHPASTPYWTTFELSAIDMKVASIGLLDQIAAGVRWWSFRRTWGGSQAQPDFEEQITVAGAASQVDSPTEGRLSSSGSWRAGWIGRFVLVRGDDHCQPLRCDAGSLHLRQFGGVSAYSV
jgi:hypothetical protein